MDSIQIDDGSSTGGAPATKLNGGAGEVRSPQIGAPLLSDILTKRGRNSELSVDATNYIETLTGLLEKQLGENNVVVARVQDKILDIYRVTSGNNTMLLTFNETYSIPADTHIPPTEQIGAAAVELKATVKGVLLNNIVVTQQDYREVNKMATHITDVFSMASGKFGDLTIDSLRRGRFSISTNINEVRDVIRRFNPKAIMPRTDIGIVVNMTEEIPTAGNATGIKQSTPILVIGAYTNFISTAGAAASYGIGNTSPAFMSVVTITSIFSPVMTKEMLCLAIPLAADEFIRRNGWVRPYTKFDKKSYNLGSLIADEKGKPFFIDSMPLFMEFVTKNISRPYLAIDVTDGVARIPGIEGLRYGSNTVQKGLAKFLCLPENATMGEMVFQRFPEYIGEVNNEADSREVDYINLVSKNVSDMNVLLRYLYVPSEPFARANLISKTHDMKTLYTNVRVILNAEYVDRISRYVAEKFRPLWEANVVENNIGALGTGTGNQFAVSPTFGMNTVGNGWAGSNTCLFGG